MNQKQILRSAFAEYFETVEEVFSKATVADGLFGTGSDPKQDPCHQAFYEKLSRLLERMLHPNLTEQEAMAIVDTILRAEDQYRDQPDTVRWMLRAVQGLTVPFLPYLSKRDAKLLLDWYKRYYPFLERFPYQRTIIAELKKER